MKASAGKRILMLIENNPFRLDPRVKQEANALTRAGYQVTAISPSDSESNWREKIDDVWVYSYPAPTAGLGVFGYVWEYAYSLAATFVLSLIVWASRGFDVIHAANPPDTQVFLAAFYKLFGIRFVFDHHDIAPEMYRERFNGGTNPLVHKALLMFEKLSCRLADHIIATNESYKAIEMQRHGIPPERISIVRNGPLTEKFCPSSSDPVLRSKARVILGFVGVMARQDGVDYLLRALHHLKEDLKRTDFYCVIIGKGSTLDDLKKSAKELNLEGHVWFTGFVPDADMLRYLSTVDICIDPDPSNPFNDRCTMIKMMEYMAMGKPIVAFDLPEHRVTAGNAALYVCPNDELDFARKIESLMDDPQRRYRMGVLGRQRIETKLNWDQQSVHLIKAYERLCSISKR
jgi:glycosyltransferase involved in cell wall biosynthesis